MRITHHPPGFAQRGKAVGYYAIIFYKGGTRHIDIMSREDVEAIRNNAKSKNSPAWRYNFDEMGRKTVCKRALKTVPKTPRLEAAMNADNEVHGASYIDNGEVEVAGARTQSIVDSLPPAPDEPEDVQGAEEAEPVDDGSAGMADWDSPITDDDVPV
jgi:recombinational DNA repair protein RecT